MKYFLHRNTLAALISLVALLVISACQSSSVSTPRAAAKAATSAADLVLLNGKVYTVDAPVWAEAIAVKDERIVFVGDSAQAQKLVGANTRRIDLNGRFLMPGIIDAHLHPVDGAMKSLYRCNFPFSASLENIRSTVAECVKNAGERTWVVGGRWDSDFFINNKVKSPREFLDEVSGGKAIMLIADSGHDAWLNSKALELSNINKESLDPHGGTIVRDAAGEPNGVLLENATHAAREVVPSHTDKEYIEGVRELMRIANAYGVTGMKDASAEEADVRALAAVSKRGELSAHMATSLALAKNDWTSKGFDLTRLLALRDKYATRNVDTRFVKIFLDGVPTSSRTAAMLANYLPADDANKAHSGSLHFTPEQLKEMLVKLDAAGFTVKTHTAGDRSVRVALDAIEYARRINRSTTTNNNSHSRHELAHAGFIAPEDIKRFRDLQAVADLSPYLWHPSPIIDSVVRAVGPRGEQYWPMKDLLAADAPILAGSDWPAAVASMDPWIGLEAMVTRADPTETTAGTLWFEQAIPLADALRIFTLDGARALRIDQDTGSLVVGKLADFIVLEQNLFEQPLSDIADTSVIATFFQGKLVYTADDAAFPIAK